MSMKNLYKQMRGQEWKKQLINELGCNIAGSFEDYLYDFYPEMLM